MCRLLVADESDICEMLTIVNRIVPCACAGLGHKMQRLAVWGLGGLELMRPAGGAGLSEISSEERG